MGIDLGNLAALRTFRVLRALKTVAIIPGCINSLSLTMECWRRLSQDWRPLSELWLNPWRTFGTWSSSQSSPSQCLPCSASRSTWASSPTSVSRTSPMTAPGENWMTRRGLPSTQTGPTGTRRKRPRTISCVATPAARAPVRPTTPALKASERILTTTTQTSTPLAGLSFVPSVWWPRTTGRTSTKPSSALQDPGILFSFFSSFSWDLSTWSTSSSPSWPWATTSSRRRRRRRRRPPSSRRKRWGWVRSLCEAWEWHLPRLALHQQ